MQLSLRPLAYEFNIEPCLVA